MADDLAASLAAAHPTIRAFKTAVEADDFDGALALLAEDVTFTSPVVFKPYEGRMMTSLLLTAAGKVFDGTLRYERVLVDELGAALVFRATVNGREIHGTDFIRLGDDGKIVDFAVMIRPMSGIHTMAEAMQAMIEELTGSPPPKA